METALKYLKNPMAVGVYNLLFTVDFSNLNDFIEQTRKAIEMEEKKAGNSPTSIFNSRIYSLENIKNELKQNLPVNEKEYFLTVFNSLTRIFYDSPNRQIPKEIEDAFLTMRAIGSGGGTFLVERSKTNIFESHVVKQNNDAISIRKSWITGNKWLFDILSLKQETCLQEIDLLKKIPSLVVTATKEAKQHFSSRYANKLYPKIVELWLGDDVSSIIPQDLKSFLVGASKYISIDEWRTSIVLSAIAVESVLAELYEELYRKTAPDIPLGNLFAEVGKKCNFPVDVIKAEDITNSARIAAVHRSTYPVSDRESINALFGATNFILWYHSQ